VSPPIIGYIQYNFNRERNTMNVKTLIELLEQLDPNAIVEIDTGDDQIELEWDMVTPAVYKGQELVVFGA
jgi:hypothetical protein